ncbi:MAG: exonuclease domain-containing protein [Rhodocyclaceae bacterium]|nr:exonuclease domain-containing protein [Rhodocyclaceae bacterium]
MSLLLERPLAFVDIETTGGTATRDRVTEVAVITWDGIEASAWSQLLNPGTRIPTFIESLTGISNDMVEAAPEFANIAEDLALRLHGHIFVAHNARFDYAFLKNEFRRVGIDFRAPVLCTVKYARELFPEQRKHNLDSLIERHDLAVKHRHRALADAQAIFDFWCKMDHAFPAEHLHAIQKLLLARPSLPSHIDADLVDQIPDQHGVYFFYGENDLPIYVGKANQLKQRVLSHFSSDHAMAKELSISQQIRRIEWQECAGEIDALMLEARLIKEMQPTLNQRLRRNRDLCSWFLREGGEGNFKPELVYARDLDFGRQPQLYGLFRSAKEAKGALQSAAREQQLCMVTLGLEKGNVGKPCFARQLKRCRGACCGDESLMQHGLRLMDALGKLRLKVWPFDGPAILREGQSVHVLDAWCHLGTAESEAGVTSLLQRGKPTFDQDTYRILLKHLDKMVPWATAPPYPCFKPSST